MSHCLSTLFITPPSNLSKSDPAESRSIQLAQSCRGATPRSVKVWTRLPVLPRFFMLLLLLFDKPCRLPAVAADVHRLLRIMNMRPASLQCSTCYP